MSPAERRFDERLYEQVCFACGRHNSIGLRLTFAPIEVDGRAGVEARYEPREQDQGFPGVVHGGILVTLLDEAMAWALFAHHNSLGVTAKMETRYRQQVSHERPLTVRGYIERARGRRVEVAAELLDESGGVLVESSALFLVLPDEQTTELLGAIGWSDIWAEGGPLLGR